MASGSDKKCADSLHLPLEIKVREDLVEFYDVVNYADRTLRCKLAGRNACRVDGKVAVLKFNPSRGWYNFERHLIQVHKVPKEIFQKGPKSAEETNIKKQLLRDIFKPGKYCLACLSPILTPTEGTSKSKYHESDYTEYFPGCRGSSQLSLQLFHIFFLRNILNFPSEICADILRNGNGMPETWFFLCPSCTSVALKAATIHRKLISLKDKLKKIRSAIEVKLHDNTSTIEETDLTEIENKIRNYVKEDKRYAPQQSMHNHSYPIGPLVTTYIFPDDYILEGNDNDADPGWVPVVKIEDPEHCTEIGNVQKTVRKKQALPVSTAYSTDNDILVHDTDDADFKIDDVMDMDIESDESDIIPLNSSSLSKKKHRKRLPKLSKPSKLQKLRKRIHKKKKAKLITKPVLALKEENEQHESWDEEAKAFTCKLCPATYQTVKRLLRHLKDHEANEKQNNEFTCKQCGYPCPTARSKEFHTMVKHKVANPKLSCSLCAFTASCQRSLGVHMKEHKLETSQVRGKFLCKFCNRLFLSYPLLCNHQRNAHHQEMGWNPIVCTVCERIFSSKRHLRDHVLQTHKKESRFYCDVCGRGFMYMSKLRRHMNAHAQERTYVCEICGADFHYTETLKAHIKKDHPESITEEMEARDMLAVKDNEPSKALKYECKHCGISLASSTLLSRHVKTHEDVFRHKCDVCDRRYATFQSLRRHLDINHAEKQVPCQYCDKKFPHQEYVRAHYKYCKHHPNRKERKEVVGEPLEASAEVYADEGNSENDEISSSNNAADVKVMRTETIVETTPNINIEVKAATNSDNTVDLGPTTIVKAEKKAKKKIEIVGTTATTVPVIIQQELSAVNTMSSRQQESSIENACVMELTPVSQSSDGQPMFTIIKLTGSPFKYSS